MILRLFRAPVTASDETALVALLRDSAIPAGLAMPGLRSLQPAFGRHPDGLELVLVSTWADVDTMLARRPAMDATWLPGAGALLGRGRVELFELVTGCGRGLPLSPGRLRITTARLRPTEEAAYFAWARDKVEELLDDSRLLSVDLGRRLVSGAPEAIAVSLWPDEGALDAIIGPDHGRLGFLDESVHLYDGPPIVEELEALTLVPEHPGAPAILLADDERRLLHATTAATALTGHSLARLRTMRIDDLAAPATRAALPELWEGFVAEGSVTGAFIVRRHDGAEVALRVSARARAPWPGSHAAVLVPEDAPKEPDVDRALAEAGFVSRIVTRS